MSIKVKKVVEKPNKNQRQKLSQEEKHLISAYKQGYLLKAGKLKMVDAKAFLTELNLAI
ncbi:hypothetical protein [Mucilaginibacter sp.]|uniref:hypothetical protein n=1 Tax=Mucilaginibacter sp. TaxID=1882438 RepID=UPI003B003C5B